jgi:translin
MTDLQATAPNASGETPGSIPNLDAIAARIRSELAIKSCARDKALGESRELIRHCSLAIRAIHRCEYGTAEPLLAAAWSLVLTLQCDLTPHPDLYSAGYVQDALKEYAEARTVLALVLSQPLPDPETIHVPSPAYLNGLAEAVGELRRYVLDCLRRGDDSRLEGILRSMDEIYTVLVSMDYPDALTANLRRTTDVTRGIIEKTRGDLTYAQQQKSLERSLHAFELRVIGQVGQKHGEED